MGRILKITDKRYKTKGGQIRIEVWADAKTRQVTSYNLAYIKNQFNMDNGRLLGFDDSHLYPGFTTLHHCHWRGVVYENNKFISFDETLNRFERHLRRLKQSLGKDY